MQQFVSVTFMFIYLFQILCLDLCIVIYSTQKLKKKGMIQPRQAHEKYLQKYRVLRMTELL